MTVICKVNQCPYRSESGFCKNNFISMTQQGACGQIYNKYGEIKEDWQNIAKEEVKNNG